MNKRERIILIVTLCVVLLAVGFLLLDNGTSSNSASDEPAAGDLNAEQKAFRKNIGTLRDGALIRNQYKSIDAGVVDQVKMGRRPEQMLINELAALLTDRLNIPNPDIKTGVFSAIPSVNEYCYVDILVNIPGTYKEIVNLLLEMNRIGLLIKTFKITQTNRSQSDMVNLTVTVSRLVKVDDNIKKKLNAGARNST